MDRIRVLVVDGGNAGGLVRSLEAVIASADAFEFQLARLPFDRAGAGLDPAGGTESEAVRPVIAALCLAENASAQAQPLIESLLGSLGETPLVLVLGESAPQRVFDWLKAGVVDFMSSPLRTHDVLPRLLRACRWSVDKDSPAQQLKLSLGLDYFIGQSPAFAEEVLKIPKLARCDVSVLIGGETGTGKELFARAIHYLSPRSGKPFVPINCGALPAELVENELFGHEAGAFTGAASAAPGLIRESDGGTLFLDEIDSLPPQSQVKLLRFLQEKQFRPLGSLKTCKVDVRILAASNANFEEAIRSCRFRSDLYFRLNVVPISMPALRQRREDIPLLASHFLAKYAAEFRQPNRTLSGAALRKLLAYDWPGNVRELENTIERAVVLTDAPEINSAHIKFSSNPAASQELEELSFKTLKSRAIAEFERGYISRLLALCEGNITRAARTAKKNRRAFWQLMRKHDIRSAVLAR